MVQFTPTWNLPHPEEDDSVQPESRDFINLATNTASALTQALTTANEYADSGDAATLADAKTYADAGDAATLADAKTYADSGDATTLADAKTYADAGDAATLSAANEYTDEEIEELRNEPGMPVVVPDLEDYAAVTVDDAGRVSEGTRWDGTKVAPHLEATRSTIAGQATEQVAPGDYATATVDAAGRMSEGTRWDGTKHVPVLEADHATVAGSTTEEVPATDYAQATVDSTGRLSEGTLWDGTKYFPNLRVGTLQVTGSGGLTTSPVDVVILAGQSNALYRWHSLDHPVTHDLDPRLMVWWNGAGQMTPIPVTHGEDVGKGFARAYLHHNPTRSAVIVPCALGSTGFSPSANGTWDRTQPDNLYDDMIDAAQAAMAAAGDRLGHVMMLWVQGEADRGALTESQYAAYLDDLIATARTDLSAPDMEVIVGSMAPAELLATPPANQGVARAHVDTPRRVVRTAYQFGPEDFQNYQQDIHYSNPGRALKGAQMFDALYRARLNITGQTPIMPHNLAITRPVATSTDTGVLDITTQLDFIASGTVLLQSRDGWNFLDFEAVSITAGQTGSIFLTSDALAAYAPDDLMASVDSLIMAGVAPRRVQLNTSGGLRIYGVTDGDVLNGSVVWPMNRPLPAGSTDDVRITWDAPPCRFTAFNLEVSIDGGAWETQTLATPVSLDHTMAVAASSTIAARISTTNEVGTSYPSLEVTA